jgi:nitrate reductase (cytochrome), electron transfer subunit
MDRDRDSGAPLSVRLAMIAGAVVLMVALIVTLEQLRAGTEDDPYAGTREAPSTGNPIAHEAEVFRTTPDDFAVDADVPRRDAAHPRDLAMFRAIREFPGAPPRVPHGLTTSEYRSTGCNACHERGGYSVRFASYTPMTPHPEYSDCLQCHTPDARLVGLGFPDRSSDAHCNQCHAPDGSLAPAPAGNEWQPGSWPRIGQRDYPDAPPLIPHDLELRGNCVACHYGPAAVEEVRTPHGDRASCRQCHLTAAPQVAAYTREPAGGGQRAGGAP